MNAPIVDEVIEQLQVLPQHLQLQALEFIRELASKDLKGTLGQQLLDMAGAISLDDLQLMSDAIERDCERVDIDEW